MTADPVEDDDDYYQHQQGVKNIAETLSNRVRTRMFASLMTAASPTKDTKVLDVGVSSNQRSDTNFFERMYPHPEQITAVGLADASFLEQQYPGLRFVQGDALNLPFPDKSFDLAVSWAVIEHLGSRERQKKFVNELCRVSKSIFITTPNRYYPVEFHTVMPLIHWLPPETFRSILRALRMPFYASEDTLNLLDQQDFLKLLPPEAGHQVLNARLMGLVSNLGLYATTPQASTASDRSETTSN